MNAPRDRNWLKKTENRQKKYCWDFVADALEGVKLQIPEDPMTWLRENIRLNAVRSDCPRDFEPRPYQIEPLIMRCESKARAYVAVAVEQTGKTLIWVLALLYLLANKAGDAWIVYPSEDAGAEKNNELVEPLMRAIPKFKKALERRGSKVAGPPARYNFPWCNVYFSGALNSVISKTIKYGIGDERDQWPQPAAANVKSKIEKHDNISNLKHRIRDVEGAHIDNVCSPRLHTGIWVEFMKSSQGYWHLRCLGKKCGAYHPSHDLLPLQWSKDLMGYPEVESLRWVCPACKREHVESEAKEMNMQGKYIHKHKERLSTYPGHQWGALANPWSPGLAWPLIMEAVVEAGRSGSLEKQADVRNSFRGLPMKPGDIADERKIDRIKEHTADAPDPAKIALILFSADTQNESFFFTVRGYDQRSNSYLLAFGEVKTFAELEVAWNAKYLGRQAQLGIIDEGGGRSKQVQAWVAGIEGGGLYTYKGNSQSVRGHDGKYYKFNEAEDRILARPQHYQAELLHRLYFMSLTVEAENWFLPPEIGSDEFKEYFKQLAGMSKGKGVDGDALENWKNHGLADHYFDAEKQQYVLFDFAVDNLAPELWSLPMPFHAPVESSGRTSKVEYEG